MSWHDTDLPDALLCRPLRPVSQHAQAKYLRNLELTKLPDFAQRMRYFILHHEAKVVRIHTGGDFYSVRYLRQWLKVMNWLPQVQFFTYTRCWRILKLKPALDEMAQFPQIRLWYSCDRDTGIPLKCLSRFDSAG
ncbi:MAG: hypothetical protein QM703_20435 [Gemmatales bacterium]